MEEEKEEKNIYTVRIGKLLREVINRQKENISKVTWECTNPSDCEAGELIAKKVIKSNLV